MQPESGKAAAPDQAAHHMRISHYLLRNSFHRISDDSRKL